LRSTRKLRRAERQARLDANAGVPKEARGIAATLSRDHAGVSATPNKRK
jgi:hypothetical protein